MKILLLYPNTYGMNMIPPALGIFTAILKNAGHELQLFNIITQESKKYD